MVAVSAPPFTVDYPPVTPTPPTPPVPPLPPAPVQSPQAERPAMPVHASAAGATPTKVRRMVVSGRARLTGEITANGAKNAATKMMASALLTREPVVLENVPDIDAIHTQAELLRSLGATVEFEPAAHRMTIVAERLTSSRLPADLAEKERSPFVMVGPLLARTGAVEAPRPGG